MSTGRAILGLCVLAMVTFMCVSVMVLPMSDGETADRVNGQIGEFNPTYKWKMPVYTDDSNPGWVVEKEFELHISEKEYRNSMHSSVFRVKTVLERSAAMMIQPNDPYVLQIADYLTGLTADYNDYQRINTALFFVQSAIEYKTDIIQYGQTERWAYPLETLYSHAGDCEDVSVLFVSITMAMGYDSLLLQYDGHVAAGVAVDGYYGRTYTDGERNYLFCECAADGCLIDAGSGLNVRRWSEMPELVRPHTHLHAQLMGSAYTTARNLVYVLTGI